MLKPTNNTAIILKEPEKFNSPPIFTVGEKVLVGGLGPGSNVKWKEGVVMKVVSGVTYLVKVEDKIMYKHVNSLRKSFLEEVEVNPSTYHVPFVPLTVTDSVTPVDNSLQTLLVLLSR
ncbi:hypothetical protein PPYR_14899 [Photinus pyralis]|uniref:Uncharacterized protein n=1 Tax=Photinus pyralis TaxID=7054 RepID=A0A1Y1NGE8_PHOPY|nr:hypothetical protein PPYR_14899 [Photinus pyralis]